MRWASVLPFAFVFTTTSLFAQAVYRMPQQISAEQCPVGLEVTHGAGLPVSMAADDPNGPGFGGKQLPPAQSQEIHLMLTNSGTRDIAGMEITVHGLRGKWRAVPLDAAAPSIGAEVSKTVQLSLNVKHDGHAVRELSLSHFAAVTSVDVDLVEYSDGSQWKAPSAAACSVTPNPFMLVAAR